MAAHSDIGRSIEQAAVARLRRFLQRHDDQGVFTLTEISEATSMDPNTVAGAMELLSQDTTLDDDEYSVTRQDTEYGELRWAARRRDEHRTEGHTQRP